MYKGNYYLNVFQDLKDYARKYGEVTYAECYNMEERVGYVRLIKLSEIFLYISKMTVVS